MAPDVTIIIVSWNVREQLRRCLKSIQVSRGVTVRTIVIDNASQDGSVDSIRQEFPEVTLMANVANRGFAAAVNQGLEKARGDVLLLNPDVLVQADTLVLLEAAFQRNPRAGIVGPQLRYPDGTLQPSVRRFPKKRDLVFTLLKLPNLFPGLVSRYVSADCDYEREQTVDQIMGSCFLIREQTLQDVGKFDDGFYIWFEEVDYCLRAKAQGWTTMLIPQARATHERAASFRQVPPLSKQRILVRSMLHYARKHLEGETGLRLAGFVSLVLAFLQQAFHLQKPTRARNL